MSGALYRKYRPGSFAEVRGQEPVIETLQQAIQDNSISHAYLFSGSRGTGKTSIARILAREIGTSNNDLYEIDAASNRGIDDVRALREAVQAHPFESPYKVYIIDEVHMLTKEAFNALLKTLEEPPKHAIFMLATTELHKLPDTVVSRCEVHHFKKPTESTLKAHIDDIASQEGYSISPEASELIALLGDGSFRDSLGVLQKIMSSVDVKEITTEHIETISGAPKSVLLRDLLTALSQKNLEQVLIYIRRAYESSTNMELFQKILIQYVRYILLLRFAPALMEDVKKDLGEDTYSFLEALSKEKDSAIHANTLHALLVAHREYAYSAIPSLSLELALIKILS